MKNIGILGGLGPEATIDYYKAIIDHFNKHYTGGDKVYPEIVIYSVDIWKLVSLFDQQRYDEATTYIAGAVNRIKAAGADFAVLSANTPHLIFSEIQTVADIPLISIVESCAVCAQSLALKKCALLGTKFTMQNDFYQKVFQRDSMEIVVPNPDQIEYINQKVFNEMELGIFSDATRRRFLEIVSEMKELYSIDSVILGCTEFPLLLPEPEYLGLPFLNTTKIHVEAILRECLAE
ncbi:MAG: aspartate/glutamate racemase family protein [Draconibacterium sp.]